MFYMKSKANLTDGIKNMWPFKKVSKQEEERDRKILASQMALLEAATNTADVAENVTFKLRNYLTDSIKQFEAIIRILTDALIVCDEKGLMQAFNPSAEMIFGVEAKDILKTNIMNLVLVDGRVASDPALFWEKIQNDSDNVKGIRSNGETFPLDMDMVRLVRSDQKIVILVLIRDLTKETELQRRIDIHEYRYNSIFNFISDGILIVQNNKIVAANVAASKLFGRDDLLSLPLDRLVDPEHRSAVKKIHGEIEAISTRYDGLVLQLIFSSTSFSWNDAPANLITIKDISKLKSFEYVLKNHRSNCVDMIVCFDANFKISYANEPFCSYYKMSKKSLIGEDIRNLMSDSEKNLVLMNLQTLTEQCPERRLQVNTKTENGVRLLDWVDSAVYKNGTVVEYQRIGRDVTEIFKMV